MSQRDDQHLQGLIGGDGQPTNLDGTPSQLDDMAAAVAARVSQIKAQVPVTVEQKIKDLPLDFIRQCLTHNRVGDAALWVTLFGDTFVWVHEWKKMLVWTGQHWDIDPDNRAALASIERVCEVYEQYIIRLKDDADEDQVKAVRKRCNVLRDRAGRENLLACAVSIDNPPVISQSRLDAQPYLLPTPTGVVDLRTAESTAGRQDQYLLNPCVTPWTGADTPCPTFERFLFECMDGDQEMVEFLIRLFGYGLLGKKHLHVWAIFYGPRARNGKDTCMNTLNHVLGQRLHVRFNTQMLMEQKWERSSSQPEPDLMALRGARIAYCSEASSSMKLNQAKVKDMTGGGNITARGLTDKEMSTWRQNALLFALTNYLPKFNTDDDGTLARTICVEWPIKFVANPTKPWERQIDYDMEEKLKAEASGILARIVRGARDVLEHGLRIPEKVMKYTREQWDSFDDIGRFLRECCEIEEPPSHGRDYETRIAVSELVKICNWWCKKILGNTFPYKPKGVTQSLEKKGVPTRKSSVMHYIGVAVLPEILAEYNADTGKAEERLW